MGGLGWVDLSLLAALAVSVLVGVWRGFVFELLSLAGWLVAYFAAQHYAVQVAPHLPVGASGSPLNLGAAFAAVFFGVLLVWTLAARLVRLLVQATPLSLFDRLLGGCFGLLRGVVVLLALATLLSLSPMGRAPAWQASHGATWLQISLQGLKPLFPAPMQRYLPA